jgi:predicted transglutaminase-like cysteine proteinase
MNLAFFVIFSFSLFFLLSCSSKKEFISSDGNKSQINNLFTDLKSLVNKNTQKHDLIKLKLVNDFVNKNIQWIDDKVIWNKNDYWATPMEVLSKRAGDCEDFSIVKYFTLISLGVPMDRLKLSYVKLLADNQSHMVLTYYETNKAVPIILDNIHKRMKRASRREDIKPIYSFNDQGIWLQKRHKLGNKIGTTSQLRLWLDLNKRINKELSTESIKLDFPLIKSASG